MPKVYSRKYQRPKEECWIDGDGQESKTGSVRDTEEPCKGLGSDLPAAVLSEHCIRSNDNQGHFFKMRRDRPSVIMCFGKFKYGDLSALYLA